MRSLASSPFRHFFLSRAALLLECVLLVVVTFSLVSTVRKRAALREEVQGLQDELAFVRGKRNDLEKVLAYTKSPSYLELEAKKKLNKQKEGEHVVVIVDEQNGRENDVVVEMDDTTDRQLSNSKKWWRYFFH